jgi:hypothetical protein
MGRLVTIAEAAKELGYGTSNIHRLIKLHGIKKQKKKVVRVEKVIRRVNVNHIDIDELIRLRDE